MAKIPYILIIRDGWGYNPDSRYNAVKLAKTPNHDKYIEDYPTALIIPSGENVGLPSGNQGSSEVGHLNLGAGRVVYQALVKINKSIDDGDFYKNQVLVNAFNKAKSISSNVHVWGLVQDQGVHSHNDHLVALIKMAKELGIKKEQFIVHVFSDGRDTPPQSAKKYVEVIDKAMNENNTGVFGSISGRYYGMDRDTRWDRVQLAYDMLTTGKSEGTFPTIYKAIEDSYSKNENDEFIKPRLMPGFKKITDNDVAIFFNYRLDRTRELTRAFVDDNFNSFPTVNLKNLDYVCFTEYYDGVEKSSRAKVNVAFQNTSLTNLYGEFLAKNGLKQLRIAETEKYAHVTFFFNGQSDIVFENEERILIPSPKIATYDLKPEMSAFEVKDKVVEAIASDKYDVIILNFANPDMVGHTGIFEAAKTACTVVDKCVGEVVDAILSKNGVALITADHGNAETMLNYETNEPFTAHTTNLVWLSIVSKRKNLQKKEMWLKPTGGKLADVIPTLIEIMGLKKPSDMTGESLIERY